jgi:hypothetical protein
VSDQQLHNETYSHSPYSYLNAQSLTDPNSAGADTGAQILIDNIEDTKSMLASLNLGKDIPVGNSDAGSFFSTKVLQSVDYGVILNDHSIAVVLTLGMTF